MANANWSNPQLTTTYTDFLTNLKDRDEDLALQFDSTTSTNIPTNAIRWDSGAGRWKKWNGTLWGELTSNYALTGLSTVFNASIGGTLNVTGATTLASATATTPSTSDNSTKIATTAYVQAQNYVPASGGTFTGSVTFNTTPVVGTLASSNNSTSAASTAFVRNYSAATYLALNGGAMTGDLSLYASSPTSAASAVPRSYIDARDWKQSVRYASTSAIAATPSGTLYLRGSANGALSIDSASPSVNDRVLLVAQASGAQNGVYQVNDAGSVSTPWILQRPTDADTWTEIAGSIVPVQEGTSNADKIFLCSSNTGGTLGTTAITWQTVSDAYVSNLIGTTGPGFVTKSGSTASARSITVAGSGLTIANGDGLSGNPLITLASDTNNTVSTIVFRDSSGAFAAGRINLKAQGAVRLEASGSTNYIGLKAPSTVTSSVDLVLPDGAGSDTQVLQTNGAGVLSWATARRSSIVQVPIATGTEIANAVDSWVTKITVNVLGLQTSSSNVPVLHLGTSGGYVMGAGYYLGTTNISTSLTGALLSTSFPLASSTWNNTIALAGQMVLIRNGGSLDQWFCVGQMARESGTAVSYFTTGRTAAISTVTNVRLYINGSNTFTNGSVQFTFES